jgi:tRNA-dihydrouridine synthase A
VLFGDATPRLSRADTLRALIPTPMPAKRGVPLRSITRHVLGLFHGQSGGRRFRQILSDSTKLRDADSRLLLEALAAVEPVADAA